MNKHLITAGTLLAIMLLSACSQNQATSESVISSSPPAIMAEETNTADNHKPSAAKDQTLPMLSLNGRLYRLLSEQTEPMGDAGSVSGYISSSVATGEIPGSHEQSNFGSEGNPYCLDQQLQEVVAMIDEEWLRFTELDLSALPVHTDLLNSQLALLGADGVELHYADNDVLVFHSYAGLFRYERGSDGWGLTQTLDLKPLEAEATQGDYYSLIRSDRDIALISPKCYAPDHEIPITLRYHFAENRLEPAGRFQDYEDIGLVQSSSEETAAIWQKLQNKPELNELWISNLYPIVEASSNLYGFVAVGADGLSSIQYGLYQSDIDRLELEMMKGDITND